LSATGAAMARSRKQGKFIMAAMIVRFEEIGREAVASAGGKGEANSP